MTRACSSTHQAMPASDSAWAGLSCRRTTEARQDCSKLRFGYTPPMTKRLVDIDDATLAAVQAELGTSTMKETVDVALNEVLALAARRRVLLAGSGVDESLLTDSGARQAAWRSNT